MIAKRDIPAVTFANSEADLNGLLPDSGKSVQFSPLITSPPAPNAQKSRAHKRRFHEPLQADLGRPVLLAKIFLFLKIRNRGCLAPSRLDQEGRFAVVTNVEAGCGGRFGDALTSDTNADGEVVWS